MKQLIFVHVAKAGGSSLLKTFRDKFGGRLLVDYSENPADPLSPRRLDPTRYNARQIRVPDTFDCVHGHFHPGKYAITPDVILSTILRDPIDNIISIYFYWKSLGPGHDALHDYFLAQNLSLLETARLPILRHLFSETYFGGFDMTRFNLIGRHDRREEALKKMGYMIGDTFQTSIRENVTPATPERQEAQSDVRLRRALEDTLSDDVRFYERFAI
jgi:hypothetical protein